MPSCLERLPALGPFLKGDDARWDALGIDEQEWQRLFEDADVASLTYVRLSASAHADEWPQALRDALATRARAETAAELLRGAEIRSVISDLSKAGVQPVLLKGAHLAYSVYPTPECRPRNDTDLLISSNDIDAARRVMAARGYRDTVQCSDLFSQFEVQKTDAFGMTHAFDVHWKISTQPVFADVLHYDDVLREAVAVPALGESARALGPVDALLLACVHAVMHHRNAERALWIYDIHLLASQLSSREFESFVERAIEKRVSAVCLHEIRRADAIFRTGVPGFVRQHLSRSIGGEASAVYLERDRRWHDELLSSVHDLPSWRARIRLMRNVLFPDARYMRGAYHLAEGPMATLLLPALYVHRNVRGGWRILLGRK